MLTHHTHLTLHPVSLPSGSITKTYTIPPGSGTSPLWFSCAQATHCQQGMVFAINAPASNHTFVAFKANAPGPAGTTVAVASTGAAVAANTLGSHDLATANGSVFLAASVRSGATGSVTDTDILTTTAAPTGGAGAAGSAGSA
ncbi:hypothetical protein CVT25_015774 [Psilocybe cyanescens]|uniref:Phytocyanin domain-containing protein n=1 Tax=Psilocybe cyanescens TaxID=93625 RepID=A0A409XGE3_PSICY|nr:hypothetical protein CVT25_015774 [Psilocybe cyanescens]